MDARTGGAGNNDPQPPTPPAPEPTITPAPEPAPEPAPDPDPEHDMSSAMAADVVFDSGGSGMWECLNSSGGCTLCAPDPRTPGKPFEGLTQAAVRTTNAAVRCPACGGDKVIYRGDVQKAAEAAA